MSEENQIVEQETEVLENADIPETQEAAPEETPEVKEKNNIQKRIDKITREKYEAKNELDLERKQRTELEQRLKELETKVTTTPEPTLESYDYDENAYNQAVIAKTVQDQVAKAAQETSQAQEKARQEQQMIAEFKQLAVKEAEFASSIEDYDQIAKNPNLPINDDMAAVIRTSEQGPALLYHLGKNPELAFNISNMDTLSAQRELVRIEAGLNNKPNLVSNAPTPPPGDIGGDSVVVKNMDDLPLDEWMKIRNKQVHG